MSFEPDSVVDLQKLRADVDSATEKLVSMRDFDTSPSFFGEVPKKREIKLKDIAKHLFAEENTKKVFSTASMTYNRHIRVFAISWEVYCAARRLKPVKSTTKLTTVTGSLSGGHPIRPPVSHLYHLSYARHPGARKSLLDEGLAIEVAERARRREFGRSMSRGSARLCLGAVGLFTVPT